MPIINIQLFLYLPYVHSLKEKRRILKPLLIRLHKEFNVSVSEFCLQDIWQSSEIRIVSVNKDLNILQKRDQKIKEFIKNNFPDLIITKEIVEYY
jgi:uncharacterized protein YlxP (DUF503 family)